MADTATLATLPTEILCMIGSNLSTYDLKLITRTSKRLRRVLCPQLFKRVKFSGNLGRLTEQLASLLHGSSAFSMNSIQPLITHATFLVFGVREPIPLYLQACGIALIGEFLQRMPRLERLALYIDFSSRPQQVEFNKLLRKTGKWSGPRSLRFLNCVDVLGLAAILRHYLPGTLEAVQVPSWYGSQKYKILQSQFPTLKALHLTRSGYEHHHRVLRTMEHQTLDSINSDFTRLKSLVLYEDQPAHNCPGKFTSRDDLDDLNQMVEQLIVSLNAMSHLRQFAFTLWNQRLDKRLIRQDWSEQGRRPLDDAEIDDWYSALVLRILNSAPRLNELWIRPNFYTFYRGTRLQGVMRVEWESFINFGGGHRFPDVLVN